MPLSFRQAGNLFVAGPNISIYSSGNTFAISGSASGSTVGVESISTIGTGQFSIASSVTNNNLIYRTLSGAGGFGITDNGLGRLIFTASSSSSGIISGTNIGTGTGIFCGLTTTVSSNDTLAFYNLSGGPNFSVVLNDNDEIFVDRGTIIVNSFKNEGGGAKILSDISSNFRTLSARTISGIGFNIITAATNVVSIRPTNTTGTRLYITDSTNTLTTSANFSQDSVRGTIGIGTSTGTTRLLIAAGSASQSQIRLTKSPFNVTSPTDGDIWYITTGSTLKFYKSDLDTDFLFIDNNISLTGNTPTQIVLLTTSATLTTKNIVDFSIFSTLSSLTISDTASETSIISSQLVTGNTKTLLASNSGVNPQLIVGRKYRFNAKGVINFIDFATTTFKVKLGSTIISSGVTSGNVEAMTNGYFEVDNTFTIRTTGATGTVIGSGKIITDQTLLDIVSPGRLILALASTGEKTIDTTSDKIFDVTAQFSASDSSNSLTIYEATLEYLN